MTRQISIFDIMDQTDREKYAPKKSDDWRWSFADYPKKKNGLIVFSCFACGGGSTMGYKLAGCDVVGCVEIDKRMNDIYVRNHNPKYNYLMDIREFNALPVEDIPPELFDLDVLDGSPPCTTFSIAGPREESWGKLKRFAEGQKEQTLDDLPFVFIDTVRKLRPKVVIMENVEGIMMGAAWQYVQRIYSGFLSAGYRLNHWLLKGEYMGVQQTRHRAFFVGIRQDLDIDPKDIDMTFAYEPVLFGEVKEGKGEEVGDTEAGRWLRKVTPKDKRLADVIIRQGEKEKLYTHKVFQDLNVAGTLTSGGDYYRGNEKTRVSKEDLRNIQTFPRDFVFVPDNLNTVQYVTGMSVPPVMIKRIMVRLIEQGVFDYKLKGNE